MNTFIRQKKQQDRQKYRLYTVDKKHAHLQYCKRAQITYFAIIITNIIVTHRNAR